MFGWDLGAFAMDNLGAVTVLRVKNLYVIMKLGYHSFVQIYICPLVRVEFSAQRYFEASSVHRLPAGEI